MCGEGTLRRGTLAVTVDHRARSPTGEPHEVALRTAVSEPLMREGVTEQMGVDVPDTGLSSSTPQHLGDTAVGHATLPAHPQPGGVDLRPDPEIPIERLRRFAA